MKLKAYVTGFVTLFVFLTLWTNARGQQRRPAVAARDMAYNAAHETVLQGTVLAYTEKSPTPPIGAHVTIQVGSGIVDVHLGPAGYLRANHFSLVPGDSVRFVGTISREQKNVVFLARIVQKGSLAIAIRSPQGFLLAAGAARTMSKEQRAQARQAGAR